MREWARRSSSVFTQLARQDKKFHNLRTEDWRQAQQMDPVIPHVLEWLRLPKNDRTRLKDFFYEGKSIRGRLPSIRLKGKGL